MTEATSDGSATFWRGILLSHIIRTLGFDNSGSVIDVIVGPGPTTFTLILLGASSTARTLPSINTPPLEAAYADLEVDAIFELIDPRNTMDPP